MENKKVNFDYTGATSQMINKAIIDTLSSLAKKRSTVEGYSITLNWLIGFVEAEDLLLVMRNNKQLSK
jgi:hypothetical protein